MKTLQAFWHWVDNDKPARITREHLSKTAVQALYLAEAQVAARAFGGGFAEWCKIWDLCSSSDGTDPHARPEFFRPHLVRAVRELSLGMCPLLQAMEAVVPEAPPAPAPDFKREYLSEWVSPLAPGNTFFGVDRAIRDDRPLSGARLPGKGRMLEQARELLASGKVPMPQVADSDGLAMLRPTNDYEMRNGYEMREAQRQLLRYEEDELRRRERTAQMQQDDEREHLFREEPFRVRRF